jgi:hypothetical protein
MRQANPWVTNHDVMTEQTVVTGNMHKGVQ